MPDLSKRRWWVLLVVLAGGLAGGGHLLSLSLRGDARPAPSTSVGGPSVRSVAALGNVDVEGGICRMYLTMPGSVVSRVLVKRGESVAAGAVLVKCDDAIARKKIEEARAGLDAAKAARDRGRSLPQQHQLALEQAEAGIKAVEAQRNMAEEELKKSQRLVAINQLSQESLKVSQEQVRAAEEGLRSKRAELSRLKLQNPQSEVLGLEAQVRQAESLLAQAQESLKQYSLVAPSDGTVLDIVVRAGDTVVGPSATPAVQFCPAGPRVVKVDVEQAYAPLVAVGQKVSIEDDAHGPGRWTGHVTWVADWYTNPRPVIVPDPGQFSDVRGMPCTITLDPGQPPLKINQRVIATIDVSNN